MKTCYLFGPFKLDSEGPRLTREDVLVPLASDCLQYLSYLITLKTEGKANPLHTAIGYFRSKGARSRGYYGMAKRIAEALGQPSNDGPYLEEFEFGGHGSIWGPEWSVWNFIADVTVIPSVAEPGNHETAEASKPVSEDETDDSGLGWDLFISHASEDKDSVARPLSRLLSAKGVTVWLDENQLRLGDSLRQKIDDGLAKCRYGVVIISKAFFAKQWPLHELNGLFARETIDQKVVLPIWHGVDREMVVRFSPILADRLAVSTASGLDGVAESILGTVRPELARSSPTMITKSLEIQGKWDPLKIEVLIRGKLLEEERSEKSPFSKLTDAIVNHTFVGEYNLRYRDRESMMVVTASIEAGHDFRVSAPALSLFEFERSKQGWTLVDSAIWVTRWGQWGQVERANVKVFVIGENIYALFLHGGGTGQGFTVSSISVQARVGDRYQEILTLQTAEDDSGTLTPGKSDWVSTIEIQPGTSGFYDLLIKRKGVLDGKRFSRTERFKFDGQKYISNDLYR